LVDDDVGREFPVDIATTERVDGLKKKIWEAKSHVFPHGTYSADDLDLWNVSIPGDANIDERMFAIADKPFLSPLRVVSEVFSDPEQGHIRVIVRAMSVGE
jgi:hypothetical protein